MCRYFPTRWQCLPIENHTLLLVTPETQSKAWPISCYCHPSSIVYCMLLNSSPTPQCSVGLNECQRGTKYSLTISMLKQNKFLWGKEWWIWVNWMCPQCLGQLILFVVSLLQDDTSFSADTAAPSVKTLGPGLAGWAGDLYTDRQKWFKPHRRHWSSLETMFLNLIVDLKCQSHVSRMTVSAVTVWGKFRHANHCKINESGGFTLVHLLTEALLFILGLWHLLRSGALNTMHLTKYSFVPWFWKALYCPKPPESPDHPRSTSANRENYSGRGWHTHLHTPTLTKHWEQQSPSWNWPDLMNPCKSCDPPMITLV